eukprot:TRINITY_DN77993_c0_g1_i1.p1 TRINITY_DN77993_c0_g1~~TRINITY_DN77993_c0_g1_i1.p1  ORF type:complete len:226 (+),score=28.59 TRINITY_DN77993_c0_g1_i1:78-755(+)
MVVPSFDSLREAPAPAVVKEIHSYFWWSIFILFAFLGSLQYMAGDILSMCISISMVFLVHRMVSDRCANMSTYCLSTFGCICAIEVLFGMLRLFSVLGGRQSANTVLKDRHGTEAVYETTVLTHPLFDPMQGIWSRYNLQSLEIIAGPIVFGLGAVLSWCSFQAYPFSAWLDFDEESEPILGGGPAGAYGTRAHPEEAPRQQAFQVPQPVISAPRAFEGKGHRLG